MTSTLQTYETLLAAYGVAMTAAAGTTVKTSKGYPVWGRPDAETPCAALEIMAWQPMHSRVGQQAATGATGYRGWLFARHEPELCSLVDALVGWHTDHGALDVAARRVALSLLELKRHEPETTALQEAHAVTFLVQAIW